MQLLIVVATLLQSIAIPKKRVILTIIKSITEA